MFVHRFRHREDATDWVCVEVCSCGKLAWYNKSVREEEWGAQEYDKYEEWVFVRKYRKYEYA